MAKNSLHTAAAFLALAIAASTACAAQPADDSEAVLRAKVQQAVWPADIVALSSHYLSRFPNGTWAEACNGLRERASAAVRALDNKDVQLFRSAFVAGSESDPGGRDVRQAALGDPAAALRLAHLYLDGENGVPTDVNRYVGWLQYASRLGNRDASYELAVHYRRQDQPVLASQYEARAIEMGYVPPRWLDHIRK